VNVTLTCSDGTILGEYEVKNGKLRLRSGDEGTIWGREAKRLNDSCRHIEALKSGRVTTTHEGSFLDDGTPLTDEIMAYWGWRETETGWVYP
jgi:hypothetical protein